MTPLMHCWWDGFCSGYWPEDYTPPVSGLNLSAFETGYRTTTHFRRNFTKPRFTLAMYHRMGFKGNSIFVGPFYSDFSRRAYAAGWKASSLNDDIPHM